ncbi:MAG: HAMP domain-containing protein, partial [Planctomycetota bacterium JB042]
MEFGKTIFASFFADLDFARLSLKQLLEKEFWELAVDAYITDFATDVAGKVLSGDIGINPLGAYDDESAELRADNLDLLVAAYDTERVQRRGDVIAIPLHSRRGAQRQRWGAAYIRLAIPALPALPRGTDVATVAVILAVSSSVVVGFVFLLLHLLVLNPLSRISEAATRVSAGRFDVPVEKTGRHDEIDDLIDSFNAMMGEIGQKREALERRVEEMVRKMRLTEQRLVLTDRLAAMGTLAAGIAHEINNPLGGMLNAVQAMKRRGGLSERNERYLTLVEDGLSRIRDVTQRVLRFGPNRSGAESASLHEI